MKPLPPVNPETATFWQACNEGRLLVQRCTSCGYHQFYPRLVCTHCSSEALEWVEASGRGTVETFTVIRRAVSAEFEGDVPYVVALIKLEEGVRLMSNLVNCEPDAARIGLTVMVTFEQRSTEIAIPQFQPA